jgi:hypothetical protein
MERVSFYFHDDMVCKKGLLSECQFETLGDHQESYLHDDMVCKVGYYLNVSLRH